MAPKKKKRARYHFAESLTTKELEKLGLSGEDVERINSNEVITHSIVRSKHFTCPDCGEAAPECGECPTCGRHNCCE